METILYKNLPNLLRFKIRTDPVFKKKYISILLSKFFLLKQAKQRQSKERTLALANNYKGSFFGKDNKGEYDHAIRNNYLDELNKILVKIVQSKERTLDIAYNYKGTSFCKDYRTEYRHAHNNNYLDELKKIINKDKIIQSKERTLDIAYNYKGLNFSKDYRAEHAYARYYNYLNELNNILNKRKPI